MKVAQRKRKREDSDDRSGRKQPRKEEVSNLYHLQQIRSKKSRKFHLESTVYHVTFEDLTKRYEPERLPSLVPRIVDNVLDDIKTQASVRPTDRVRLSINHPALKTEIWVPFISPDYLTARVVLQEVERVQQSNTQLSLFDGKTTLSWIHVSIPHGGGRHTHLTTDRKTFSKKKRSVVCIQNEDNNCLARAIVAARFYASRSNESGKEWRKKWWAFYRPASVQQTNEALALLQAAGIPEGTTCGPTEWALCQQALYPHYKLQIYGLSLSTRKPDVLYAGDPMCMGTSLHLYYDDKGHYDVITSMPGFTSSEYYCEVCSKGYKHHEDHIKCRRACLKCLAPVPCRKETPHDCEKCGRTFASLTCYQNHLRREKNKRSTCQLKMRCDSCGIEMNRRSEKAHVCSGQVKCKNCRRKYDPTQGHKCYVRRVVGDTEEASTTLKYVFFDFECRQDTDDGEHVPNFCVAQRACDSCIHKPITENCPGCSSLPGGREIVFEGDDTITQFYDWLFAARQDPTPSHRKRLIHEGVTCIAHNFQAYDGQFLLKYIVQKAISLPQVVMNGSKILCMTINGIRFIDSLNFLPMPLSKFPDTFGLSELKKGYFPHFFNTAENQTYMGPYPEVTFYDPDGMKPKERSKFLDWYKDKKTSRAEFNFRREMCEYCRSDCDILRRGCGQFEKLFEEETKTTPFRDTFTMASACNLVYRRHFLPDETMAIIPPTGYTPQKKYSVKALRWLQWLAHSEGITLQHARNGGEVQFGSYYVDGYDAEHHTIYEFLGCLWHGCPKCYPNREMINPMTGRTMDDSYLASMSRLTELENNTGANIVLQWEHQYDRQLKDNADFKTFVQTDQRDIQDPLNPREALYGGRTNATRLFCDIADTKSYQEIRYVDVCSLYPWVCKYAKFPKGHPEIITENFDHDIRVYEGLIKCRVIPPRRLYHPVLPYRTETALMFPLCRICAENQQQDPCQHNISERALTGTWVTAELFKALDHGYKIDKIFEIWHFKETIQYDPNTNTAGLFSGYVDKFLKIKQEASGYPDRCKTPASKRKFEEEFYGTENVRLNPENIKHNPGKRAVAKLMLNCLWGKLAQRTTLPKTEYVDDPGVFFQKLTDPSCDVHHAELVSENTLLINSTQKEAFAQPGVSSNVIVAAYVTANARLKLYNLLSRLGPRVLYFDTDSCIYVHYHTGGWNPKTENRLGGWTNELPEGQYITKFVSGGPKNYAYETSDGRVECKVRGLTLNYRASQSVNFGVMCDMILRPDRVPSQVDVSYPHKIQRTRDHTVRSSDSTKVYQKVYTKRVVLPNFNTVPYGYKRPRESEQCVSGEEV